MTKDNGKYLIEGKKEKWEVIIGLEVHAQVTSKSKLSLSVSKPSETVIVISNKPL